MREELGIEHTLLNCGHPHSSLGLGPRVDQDDELSVEAVWTNEVHDAIMEALEEAKKTAVPASLHVGRAPVQVGFNRRSVNSDGHVIMLPNTQGAVVPWVNTLEARNQDGEVIAVLFEHAAHPVIVPTDSALISADFPGAAVARIHEELGENVVPLFAQGCAGNINGFPLRTTHENAEAAGRRLGEAVLEAMNDSVPIQSDRFEVRSTQKIALPSQDLPSLEVLQETIDLIGRRAEASDQYLATTSVRPTEGDWRGRLDRYNAIKGMVERGETSLSRRFDATAVMFPREWCLIAIPHEMFCEYELWVDKDAPFDHTMTFAYTNGGEGYIPVDKDLAMGAKGGYEAACLPTWGANSTVSGHGAPAAVGIEGIIKDSIASLWAEN